MTLQADLRVARGSFDLHLELAVAPGRTVALLGPNGAGKTTALRALAGLVPEMHGSVRLFDRVLDAAPSGAHVPVEHRSIGVVFQDHRLFPHLTALDNVAFGLQAHGMSRDDARAQAATWLSRVGLASHAAARPGSLSGGQAQRVALARALVRRPQLLLLDEPLAALDASTRLEVRAELRSQLEAYEGCTVLVTHDPVDAMVLADRVVVLEAGRVVQSGTPVEVALMPRTEYVARLMGVNLLRGTAESGALTLPGGIVAPAGGVVGRALAAIDPIDVLITAEPPSDPVGWPVTLTRCEQLGSVLRVHVTGAVDLFTDLRPAAVGQTPQLSPGARVWASARPGAMRVYEG